MTHSQPAVVYSPGPLTCVQVSGADSETILHNVTTNDVRKLEPGSGCETFITDVRGKTLGHGFVFRLAEQQPSSFLFLGAKGQAERFMAHLDKYTIHEDATPEDQSDAWSVYCLNAPPGLLGETIESSGLENASSEPQKPGGLTSGVLRIATDSLPFYGIPVLSDDSVAILVPSTSSKIFEAHLQSIGIPLGDESAFHAARVEHGFPWYGLDITDSNLPQELDRDDLTISFTKGCYLGQETIARLDAMGQVQRKWVRIEFATASPHENMVFEQDGKPVCRITSVAENRVAENRVAENRVAENRVAENRVADQTIDDADGGGIAYGFVRRSHFGTGSQLAGTNQAGQAVNGKVADSP